MRASVKLAAYGAVLVIMVGAGAGVGAAAGPLDVRGDDGGHEVHPTAPPEGSSGAPASVGSAPAEAGQSEPDGGAMTVPPTAPAREATVHGYSVTLDGDLATGESTLAFTVARDGRAVRTDPYLDAAGHLVAIRDADLAYLHVHPIEGDGPQVRFAAEFPSPGTYGLFLDFAHDGQVHTAAFTVEVPADGAPSPAAPPATATAPGDEHEGH